MKLPALFLSFVFAGTLIVFAAEVADSWTRSVKERSERGALEARVENVRGDTGKWRDTALLQAAPAPVDKPERFSMDDWADQLLEAKVNPKASGETWLIFRTRQFDDNDRAWVEKIERRGPKISVVMRQSIWQGYYSKSFTYYRVIAVNLGKLPPGNYEAEWSIEPLIFTTFEDPANRLTSNPKDERPAENKDNEILQFKVSFPVEN